MRLSRSWVGPSQVRVRPVMARLCVPVRAIVVLAATSSSARGTQPWVVLSSKVLLSTTTGSAAWASGAVAMAATAPATASRARPAGRSFRLMRMSEIP